MGTTEKESRAGQTTATSDEDVPRVGGSHDQRNSDSTQSKESAQRPAEDAKRGG